VAVSNTPEAILREGLAALSLTLDERELALLLQFLDLLRQWNKAYNLTAVTDIEDMVRLHLLDSLAIAPFLDGERFIDVGTGPGLPGIPLAIALPHCHFTLLDSNGKRVRFLFQAKVALGLANIAEVHGRAETFQAESPYAGVISRAFSSLGDMVSKTAHMVGDEGVFYAMKGRYPEKELRELEKPYKVLASHRLHIPGVEGERHLIEIGKSPNTGTG